MKSFLKKLILLFIILILCCAALVPVDYLLRYGREEEGYQAAILDKLQRLESIDEPKILLVGHSNLAFGIDSKQIEEALSMPVVNLGLHGGLGNAFHEEFSKVNISKGDIVVVCHSSYSLDDINARLALETIAICPDSSSFFEKSDYLDFIKAYPEYWRRSVFASVFHTYEESAETSYSRIAFNEYGDVVFKPESGQMDVNRFFAREELTVPPIDDKCIERLNRYNQYISEQGATMVVAGYPIAYGEYSKYTEADFEEFGITLQNALDCEVISDYADYFFPYDYFYDTSLHLTQEGASARTVQLIEDLQSWKEHK